MSLSFGALIPLGAFVALKSRSLGAGPDRLRAMWTHAALQTFAAALAFGGLVSIYLNKNIMGKPHFATRHAKLGVAAATQYSDCFDDDEAMVKYFQRLECLLGHAWMRLDARERSGKARTKRRGEGFAWRIRTRVCGGHLLAGLGLCPRAAQCGRGWDFARIPGCWSAAFFARLSRLLSNPLGVPHGSCERRPVPGELSFRYSQNEARHPPSLPPRQELSLVFHYPLPLPEHELHHRVAL